MKQLQLRTLLFICLFILQGSFLIKSHSQCNLNDWQALQDLFVSTSGTTWSTNTGWDQVDPAINPAGPPAGCDLGTMHGVQVDVSSGRVKSLFLVSNQLSGTIPSSIGDLTGLTSLSLSVNMLTGSIPSSIGNLTDLTALFLFDNQLSGTIPLSVWTLSDLGQLNLSNNQLTGSIPSDVQNLTSILFLHLGQNQLSGTIPPELWTLTTLDQLNLSDNQLTGIIPSDIGNLINLSNLYLMNNQFSGPIPSEIGNLNLSNLLLMGNQFTGGIPVSFSNLTNLNQFGVANNLLTGCYDPSLTNLCGFSNGFVSNGNNFDAAWQDFCVNGLGACLPPSCTPIAHIEVVSADVYLDDACYGVILTSPNGSCYRLRVQDDGTFISEMVTCP